VKYRVAGSTRTVDGISLVIRSAEGQLMQALNLGRQITNVVLSFSFTVRLAPGHYLCTISAASGSSNKAILRVLPLGRLVPNAVSIAHAISYLQTRSSHAALAVVDTRGNLHGYNLNTQFTSASVVKAMLLVQYLRTHRTLTEDAREMLTLMITESDNASAYSIYNDVGAAGLRKLAKIADMKHFAVGESVLHSHITAADQARFFWNMNDYLPTSQRAFARWLLSHIASYETWGVAQVARPYWRVFFKSGWFGAASDPFTLVNQVARLERGGLVWSMAVLSDDNPASPYAFETLRGVTTRLLGR